MSRSRCCRAMALCASPRSQPRGASCSQVRWRCTSAVTTSISGDRASAPGSALALDPLPRRRCAWPFPRLPARGSFTARSIGDRDEIWSGGAAAVGRSRSYGCHGGRRSGVRRIALPAAVAATLLLAFASVAGAAGFGASSEPAWGPAGVAAAHTSRATRVHGSRGARGLARRHASATVAQTGTIEGKVTDAVTKAGAEGVEVCAMPLGPREEDGEEGGNFSSPDARRAGPKAHTRSLRCLLANTPSNSRPRSTARSIT